ncbi:hypothetical protein FQR65_LT06059 [Abscondita terminalis]|nr:hypothetical protein FQR65_LT06059 [Abscondita terminalis]
MSERKFILSKLIQSELLENLDYGGYGLTRHYFCIMNEVNGSLVTVEERDGLFDIKARANIPALVSPEEFSCELRIPKANYTVRKEAVYYPVLATAVFFVNSAISVRISSRRLYFSATSDEPICPFDPNTFPEADFITTATTENELHEADPGSSQLPNRDSERHRTPSPIVEEQ